MMELIIGLLLMAIMGVLMGYKTSQRLSINYKKRWQEALDIIKQEKVNTTELKQLTPPPDIPEHLKGKESVPSRDKSWFENLKPDQRERMELHRLAMGLPPKDAMGGADNETWTRVRIKQLEYGWEHFRNRYYKVK